MSYCGQDACEIASDGPNLWNFCVNHILSWHVLGMLSLLQALLATDIWLENRQRILHSQKCPFVWRGWNLLGNPLPWLEHTGKRPASCISAIKRKEKRPMRRQASSQEPLSPQAAQIQQCITNSPPCKPISQPCCIEAALEGKLEYCFGNKTRCRLCLRPQVRHMNAVGSKSQVATHCSMAVPRQTDDMACWDQLGAPAASLLCKMTAPAASLVCKMTAPAASLVCKMTKHAPWGKICRTRGMHLHLVQELRTQGRWLRLAISLSE